MGRGSRPIRRWRRDRQRKKKAREKRVAAPEAGAAPRRRTSSRPKPAQEPYGVGLLPQELVDELRVRPALGLLHHLADEEAEKALLAGAVRLDLIRVRGQHLVDERLEVAGLSDLTVAEGALSRKDGVPAPPNAVR